MHPKKVPLLFQKGHGGRPKGSPNKFTSLKASFLEAYEYIGGTQALIDWLTKGQITYRDKKTGKMVKIDMTPERRETFFKILATMLPKDVTVSGNPNAPLQVQVTTIQEMIENAAKPDISSGQTGSVSKEIPGSSA